MSGHSKFANIKHKKEKNDAAKGKIFTIIGREIAVAVKEGGPDPASNFKLAAVIQKAKANNMPNDTIERGIKKAAGDIGNVNYQQNTYEGYGPSGIAVIVVATTDNRNRTSSDLRHYFDKFGGNLGTTGCVSFMFSDKGVIIIDPEGVDEDKLMEDALEAGADDIKFEDDVFVVTTETNAVYDVKDALEKAGYKIESAQEDKIPASTVTLTNEDDILKMNKLLDMLDENEDVQDVYHNWENNE